jgi:hypothetical protein
MGSGYRRARLSALAGGLFGSGGAFGAVAGSSLASARPGLQALIRAVARANEETLGCEAEGPSLYLFPCAQEI